MGNAPFETADLNLPTEPGAPTQPQADQFRFTADDLQKARSEEKDKLYARLEQEAQQRKALEDRVAGLLSAQQEKEAAEAERLRKAEAEAKAKAEAEMDARELLAQREREMNERLAQTQTDWESRFQTLAQEREQERALLEKDRQLAEIQAYATRRVAEEADNIAPELRDFISGNSPEEIERSIELVKAKSAEIANTVQNAMQQQRAAQRGVSPAGYAPVGPLEMESGQRQYSAEDIQNMDLQQYAEFRRKAGIGGQANNRGLFG